MASAGPAFRLLGTHEGTGDPLSVKPDVWTRERMPTVSNLAVVGDHPEADGFELVQTMQAVLEGVLVQKCRHGIRLLRRNRNVIISPCQMYFNTGVGINLDRVNLHQINITGCHITYNRLGGIRIEGSEVRNLQVTGNDIEYNNHRKHRTDPQPTAELYIDVSADGASVEEVAIASNTIQSRPSPDGANLRIIGKPGRPPGMWTVTGNVIGNQEHGVRLSDCHGIVLSGNFIYSSERHNLLVERCREINITGNSFRRHTKDLGTGVRLLASQDCVVSGCTIRDEHPRGQPSGLSLLEIHDCRRVVVNGCHLLDSVPYGIDVRDSSQINVSGCVIAESRGEPAVHAAVRFAGTGTSNLLSSNVIAGRHPNS